jgi:predicted Zn-dependent peptidase
MQFQHASLPNGLEIIAECDADAHTAALGFFVRTGARDEQGSLMGVSHFLEHMMFKGTERRSAEQVDRDFDDIGADHNAFTTSELTAFHAHCLPERIDRAAEVLADILRPALRDRDFDDEKKVILEEIAMYEDHPFWVLYEQTMERYYGDHPLGHRVLGTRESISALTRDQMAEYFAQRYSADNTVLAAAGRIDFPRLVSQVESICASWRPTQPTREHPRTRIREEDFTIRSAKVNRHYTLMVSPAPAMQDDRRYAAGMLGHILGDSEGSRLYWALIEPGLAEEAQAQFEGRDGVGEFYVFLSCDPERAAEVEETARREMGALAEGLTQDDLERVRNKIATGAALQGERPAGRMRRLGMVWTYLGEYRSLESELARIDAVTLDDLRAVLAAWPLEPRVVGRLSPA